MDKNETKFVESSPPGLSGHGELEGTAVQRERGSTVHINVLPEEVLVDIFLYVKASGAQRNRPWYMLLWVCKGWSVVIWSAPVLWCDIDIRQKPNISLIQTSLQCSGSASLNISFEKTKEPSLPLILLAPHVSRIRRLHVNLAIPHTSDPNLVSLLKEIMPTLEDLELNFHRSNRRSADMRNLLATDVLAAKRLLWAPQAGQFLNLRLLSVGCAVEVSGPFPVFPSLQQLDLRNCTIPAFTPTSFVEFLSQQPHLEELSLCMCRPALIPDPSGLKLSLPPTLRRVSFKDLPDCVAVFLSSFSFPPHVDLHITRTPDDRARFTHNAFRNVLPHIFTRMLPGNRITLPILALVHAVEISYKLDMIALSARAPAGNGVELICEIPEYLDEEEGAYSDSLQVLVQLVDIFAAAPLVELRVNGHHFSRFEKRHWVLALRTFEQLERVIVERTYPGSDWDARTGLLNALCVLGGGGERGAKESGGDLSTILLGSQLKMLKIVSDMRFGEEERFRKNLERCLQSRRSRGSQLEELCIVFAYNPADKEQLRSSYTTQLQHLVTNLRFEFVEDYTTS